MLHWAHRGISTATTALPSRPHRFIFPYRPYLPHTRIRSLSARPLRPPRHSIHFPPIVRLPLPRRGKGKGRGQEGGSRGHAATRSQTAIPPLPLRRLKDRPLRSLTPTPTQGKKRTGATRAIHPMRIISISESFKPAQSRTASPEAARVDHRRARLASYSHASGLSLMHGRNPGRANGTYNPSSAIHIHIHTHVHLIINADAHAHAHLNARCPYDLL